MLARMHACEHAPHAQAPFCGVIAGIDTQAISALHGAVSHVLALHIRCFPAPRL